MNVNFDGCVMVRQENVLAHRKCTQSIQGDGVLGRQLNSQMVQEKHSLYPTSNFYVNLAYFKLKKKFFFLTTCNVFKKKRNREQYVREPSPRTATKGRLHALLWQPSKHGVSILSAPAQWPLTGHPCHLQSLLGKYPCTSLQRCSTCLSTL